jgi:hypothetical protein
MAPHHQSQQTFEINTRLVTVAAALTASGAAIACTGMALAAFAALTAGRRMLQRMETAPSEQAAAKWHQAKQASRAGVEAWRSAAGARDGQPTSRL